MQTRESRKLDGLGLAMVLGVTLAIGVYLIATGVLISRDGVFYIRQAQSLIPDAAWAARRYPIGYACLLLAGHAVASLFADGSRALVWIVSSQAVTLLCRMGALVFLYWLGRMLVGARRSFWAVLILALLPYPAHYGSDVLREWPFVSFLAAGFWLLWRALRDGKGWLFGLVGLDAGLGYLVRPMCGQLVVYALLGLAVTRFAGAGREVSLREGHKGLAGRAPAGLFLLLGFAAVVLPYFAWTGSAVPHQLQAASWNAAPFIVRVGDKSARDVPLSFTIRSGEAFATGIKAFDPGGGVPTLSVAVVPAGVRPVYRFRSARHEIDFWTMSEREKDALLTRPREVWDYERIDGYAYAEADAAPGLAPVYRFWSPVRERHFFAIDESQRQALQADAQWQSEGVAFYAFAPGQEPAEALAVCRLRDAEGRCSWAVQNAGPAGQERSENGPGSEEIVWYVSGASPLPAGAGLEGAVFRWRPETDQQGRWQFSVVASDGRRQSCQLVQIAVEPPAMQGDAEPAEPLMTVGQIDEGESPSVALPRHEREPKALLALRGAGAIVQGISENLMIFFVLPLCLGLYHRLRREAGWQERVLMIAVVVLNVLLLLVRYLWFESGSARRYSLGLVALTICYVPVGLERMARALRMALDRVVGQRGRPELGEAVWFHVLVGIGVILCVPKLLTPLGADKQAYRQAARWLRDHTEVGDTVAVPDHRISLYAERQEVFYRDYADSRRADYIVALPTDHQPRYIGPDWVERYSGWIDAQHRARLVIYQVP